MRQRSFAASKLRWVYLKWANRIPGIFQEYVLNGQPEVDMPVESDANCLAVFKHFHSLIPMAMEVKKPIFLLKPADGAIGAHTYAVKRAYRDFELLTERVVQLMD